MIAALRRIYGCCAVALLSFAPAPAYAANVLAVQAPKAVLELEVVKTETLRERGLMDRTSLAKHHGMLFVFPSDGERHFWMKHTYISLDMVFVSAAGMVTSIADRVPAVRRDTNNVAIPRRNGIGRYVIELPAGDAMTAGLVPGRRLSLPAFP